MAEHEERRKAMKPREKEKGWGALDVSASDIHRVKTSTKEETDGAREVRGRRSPVDSSFDVECR